jgi:hypothetical protein
MKPYSMICQKTAYRCNNRKNELTPIPRQWIAKKLIIYITEHPPYKHIQNRIEKLIISIYISLECPSQKKQRKRLALEPNLFCAPIPHIESNKTYNDRCT